MPVVLVVGIVVILVGVFAVATGRGGELAYEHADHAPLDLGPVSATDVALLRPPTALWGYNMQVTDEALDRIARSLRDRDIEIAALQRQLADLTHGRAERYEDGPVEPPRSWVPKHERPRLHDDMAMDDMATRDDMATQVDVPGPGGPDAQADSEQAGNEVADSERVAPDDSERVAPDDTDAAPDDRDTAPGDKDAAEEQGW